jgi:carboxypeptidase T
LSITKRHYLSVWFTLFVVAVFFAAPVFQTARAQQVAKEPLVARVTIPNRDAFERITALGLDLLEMRDGDDYLFLTTAEQIAQLRKAGWDVKVDQAQTGLLRNQQHLNTFSGGYRTVAEMRALLQSRATAFPNLAEYFVYGQSWEKLNSGGVSGSDLFGIKLTNKSRSGPKPTFFLMAAIHARELTTSELALRLVDYLLNNYGTDGDVTWLLDEHLIVIVPSVNPDGHAIAEQGFFQRKNTNTTYGGGCANPPTASNQYGVDLNRNHSFKWGTVNSPTEPRCGQTYPGPTAASEPETSAVQNLLLSLFPDQRGPNDTDAAPLTTTGTMISLHSYSNLVMWPWGWGSSPAPNAAELSLVGRKYAAYNGYTPQQAINLYATSGTTEDWGYGELGICSLIFEVGPESGSCAGFFPPFTCLDTGSGGNFWLRNLPAFLYAARIARTPYQLAQGPTPESASTVNVNASGFDLRVQLDEQFNGGQAISAAEYYIDTPPWRGGTAIAMTALDGNFNSIAETATATVQTSGQHLFYVRGRDANGNWGPVRGIFSPAVCSYSIAPSSQSFTATGGSGSVTVTADSACNWSATSNANWISITSGASGSGNGTLNYTVATHTGTSPRGGTLTIAGQTFTVNQSGTAAPGNESIGLFRSSTSTFYLRNSNSLGFPDLTIAYGDGPNGDIPVLGDWDGNGTTTIGVYRPSTSTFYLRNSNTPGFSDITISFGDGPNGDLPIAGDWDGDGIWTIGVYRPSTSTFYLRNSNTPGLPDLTVAFGAVGDKPLVGDWNGDGTTTIGLYRPSGSMFFLRNTNTTGLPNLTFSYGDGPNGDQPLAGDWNADGTTTIGVYRPSTSTFYLRNFNSVGFAELSIPYGAAGDKPLVGDWDGQ